MQQLERLSTAGLTALLRAMLQMQRGHDNAYLQDHDTVDDRLQTGQDLPGGHEQKTDDRHI
jgi:hypothetical protein